MNDDFGGASFRSPGGFLFGVQGWMWGPPRPTCITFFIDNTAKVSDQYGRPIRGVILPGSNKEVHFADRPPTPDDKPGSRKHLATHVQVVEALLSEKVDWQTLTYAGFPQLPYEELRKVKQIPPTPIDELVKITNPVLRRDAVRMVREIEKAQEKELEEMGVLLEGDD